MLGGGGSGPADSALESDLASTSSRDDRDDFDESFLLLFGFIFFKNPLKPFFFSAGASVSICCGSSLIKICERRDVLVDLLSALCRSRGSPLLEVF